MLLVSCGHPFQSWYWVMLPLIVVYLAFRSNALSVSPFRSEKSSCNIHHLLDSNWPQFSRRGGKLRSIAAMDQICISSCSFSVNLALQHQSEHCSHRNV